MTLNIASIAKDGSQRCVSDPCIIFYVLGSAGALLGLAFFYHWLRKTVRYFAKWIALNQEWSLVGPYNLRTQLGQTNLGYSSKSLSETDATQEQIAWVRSPFTVARIVCHWRTLQKQSCLSYVPAELPTCSQGTSSSLASLRRTHLRHLSLFSNSGLTFNLDRISR